MIKRAITNVHVDFNSPSMVAVGWNADDAAFHIWLDRRKNNVVYHPETEVLYKNPISAKRGEAGHFDTRRLDPTSQINKQMIDDAMSIVERDGLLTKAQAAFVAKEKADQDERAAFAARREIARGLFRQMKEFINNPTNNPVENFTMTRAEINALLSYAPSEET